MAKRNMLKITPVLVTLNVLVLLLIIGFYSFRLIKYYKLENKTTTNEKTALVDAVIKKQSYLDLTKGLVLDEETNTYRYKGKVTDNYVLYSGILFRIVSIDSNKNIKLISDKNLTLLYSGLEKGYDNSFVNKWLNKTDASNSGILEGSLYESDKLLTTTSMCSDTIEDLTKVTCEKSNSNNKISLLSLYDFKEAGGSSSYLNNEESFYLGTLNSENNNYYITETGEVGLNQNNTKVLGVRAVITLKADTILLSGSGKKDKPYVVEKHEVKTLSDAYLGDIINYSSNEYKIVEILADKVKVASTEVLKSENENLSMKFASSSSSYSDTSIVGKYLNNDYYNSLSNKESIVKSNWYIGTISLGNLDYTDVYKSKVSANIGMLTLGDFYVQDMKNIFTISRGIESSSIINVINSEGSIYGDFVTSKYNVRPAFYLDGKIEIKSGIGTNDGPYELGVTNEKEK